MPLWLLTVQLWPRRIVSNHHPTNPHGRLVDEEQQMGKGRDVVIQETFTPPYHAVGNFVQQDLTHPLRTRWSVQGLVVFRLIFKPVRREVRVTTSPNITLLSPEANLHGRDARATWHGNLAHAAHISSKARCMRHAIKT